MIKESSGNLLRADVEALVNTEGVMGKGIALQFKKAYPAMDEAYREAAATGGSTGATSNLRSRKRSSRSRMLKCCCSRPGVHLRPRR